MKRTMNNMLLRLSVAILFFVLSSSLAAFELFDNNPEIELMDGDYDEIIHYDPLIFVDNKLDDNSQKELEKIIDDIRQFQNSSRKITVFIEGNSAPSTKSEEEKVKISQEYALSVREKIVKEKIKDIKIILSARGDTIPYFTDITDDIKRLSNRVMLSLYMKIPDDTDGDGVLSDKDRCPNTKPGSYVTENGCAVKSIIALVQGYKRDTAIVVSTKVDKVIVSKVNSVVAIESSLKAPTEPVVLNKKEIEKYFGDIATQQTTQELKYLFYFDGVKILDEPKNKLQEMLNVLRSSKTLPYVNIIGHTDTKGTDEYNRVLGLKRARIIRNIIVNEKIPVLKIDVESYGESNPIIKTADEVAEKLNRRVEVFIH